MDDVFRALTPKQRRFVKLFFKHHEIGAHAVREWKPHVTADSAKRIAHKMRSIPQVAKAIETLRQEAIAELGITPMRTLRQMQRIAEFDHRKLYDDKGQPLPVHLLPDDVATALSGIETEERFEGTGETRTRIVMHKYRINGQVEAGRLLMQYQDLLPAARHKLEHTGKDGVPLTPPVFNFGFANGGPGEQPGTGTEGS